MKWLARIYYREEDDTLLSIEYGGQDLWFAYKLDYIPKTLQRILGMYNWLVIDYSKSPETLLKRYYRDKDILILEET